MPFKIPKDWPKLNILVTPWPGIAETCSITTFIFFLSILFGPNPSYLKFSKFAPDAAEDLSIALSILSFGIFADLAACTADLNLGFIAGSLSPSFAATVISFDNFEKIIVNFISTEIEWVPINSVEVNKDNKDSIADFFETLEEDDDVQNVYSNVNLGGIKFTFFNDLEAIAGHMD